jgi:hypothetical protein
VTHNPTRKKFFAKLLGVVAAASVAPRILAESDDATESQRATGKNRATRRFELRPDARAVARRDAT